MTCPRCEAENDAGSRFCEDCGARLEVACPRCGTPVTPGKKFCRSCGATLTTEPAGPSASPESYTPRHLAEKILTSKAALEGERKQVTVLFALGGAYLLDGQLDDATRIAEDELATARQRGEPEVEGQLLRLLGDIATHPDRFEVDTAEKHYGQAMTLAEEMGLRPLLAHCHLGLGKLYRSTRKREEAQEHLTTATTMYREMDMRFWLEQAEAELGA